MAGLSAARAGVNLCVPCRLIPPHVLVNCLAGGSLVLHVSTDVDTNEVEIVRFSLYT